MTTTKGILINLSIQEKIEGLTEDIQLLKLFLFKIKTASQWHAFTTVKWYSYGKLSYQSHRFYYPTQELKALLKGDTK